VPPCDVPPPPPQAASEASAQSIKARDRETEITRAKVIMAVASERASPQVNGLSGLSRRLIAHAKDGR
jgi:hypothetical protein